MPILSDIFRIAEENEVTSSPQKIGSDFFETSLTIPKDPEKIKTPEELNPLRDWRMIVNRALMRGLTKDEVVKSLGDNLELAKDRDRILAYLDKYEGLVGTVFLDSSVFENGFPLMMVPRSYTPYHRFAINCHTPRVQKETVQKKQTTYGDDILSFLDASDGTEERETLVCPYTRLPILKDGDFNEKVIAELLEQLGSEGMEPTMQNLQKEMRTKVLKIQERQEAVRDDAPALNYNLHDGEMDVDTTVEEKEDLRGVDWNLHERAARVEIPRTQVAAKISRYAPSTRQDVQISAQTQAPKVGSYVPSSEEDVEFVDFFDANSAGGMKLNDAELNVDTSAPPQTMQGEIAHFQVSGKADIQFDEPIEQMEGIRLDNALRLPPQK